nr:hypothetical protein [Kribbella sp. VKM Ac-2568]
MATVVPWNTSPISDIGTPAAVHARSMPRSTPIDWSSGVDEVLARYVCPVSSSINRMSVNVPPTSTPSR